MTPPLQPRCAWCGLYRVDGKYQAENPNPKWPTTHGMCPECAEKWRKEAEKEKESK